MSVDLGELHAELKNRVTSDHLKDLRLIRHVCFYCDATSASPIELLYQGIGCIRITYIVDDRIGPSA